jgi:hypothetical protein
MDKLEIEIKIAEYQAAQECYIHYDNYRWQAGRVLIAGVLISFGLLLGSQNSISPAVIFWLDILVTVVMSIWILFAHRCRQFYLFKLHRIYELEKDLHMEQHRRFVKGLTTKYYNRLGPKGHRLDLAIYIVTSLGGLILGLTKIGFCYGWFIIPLVIIFAVIKTINKNEYKVQESIM